LKTALLFFLPFALFSQTFEDARDGNVYGFIKLGELYWMTENLRFEEKGSVCVRECDQIRFYDYRFLDGVCPEGWRLPVVEEWDMFVNSFEGAEKARMLEGNDKFYRVDFLNKFNLFKSNSLNVKAYGRIEGGKLNVGNSIDFWTVNEATDDRFHMHLTPYSITGHAHKHHLKANKPEEFRLFPIRCVCEKLE